MYRCNIDYKSIADDICIQLASQVGRVGLQVRVRHDFAEWVHVLSNAPNTTAVSPAFDPGCCDLSEGFWLELRDGSEWPVGTITAKLVLGDFMQLVASGELWYGRRTELCHAMPLINVEALPRLRGRIAYFGGLWLHPDYRGHGLVSIVPRLVRAMARRKWAADWHCGGVLKPLADRKLPLRYYGYAQMVQVTDQAYFPVTGKRESWFVPWESPQEWAMTSQRYLNEEDRLEENRLTSNASAGNSRHLTTLRAS